MASRMGLSALSPSPIGLCRHKIAGANATQRGTMRVSAALLRCSSRSRGSKRMLHSRSPAGLDGRGATTKSSSSRRRKASKALGAVATVAAATVLAREALLPDSFAEWDDQLQWEEVHQLAQLSNMTHKDPQLVAKWFDCNQYTGALVVRDLPQVSNHYFVHVGHLPGEEHRRVHHVAIRGTVSLADLSIDLKTRQVFDEECGCMFHAGFKEVADAVIEDLEAFLEPGAEVKLAGHSLGGAAAVIVAAKLKLRGYNIGKVMTFGAPMVTDAAGAAILRDIIPVMRVTHERDPVPLTPLESGSRTSAAAAKLLSKSLGRDRLRGQAAREEEGVVVIVEEGEEEEEEEVRGEEEEVGNQANGGRRTSGAGGDDVWEGREESDGVGGEREGASSGDREEEGRVARGAGGGRRWRLASSPVYSHFGSQVVLLRRKKCLECHREETASAGSTLKRIISSLTMVFGDGVQDGDGQQRCEHCPSRGTTYYDPRGEDDCLFDSPWLRLSHPNYIHRMNHYEREIAARLEQHLLNGNAANTGDGSRSSPPLAISSRGSSSSSSSGGGGRGKGDGGGDAPAPVDIPIGNDNRSAGVGGGGAKHHAR